MQYLESLQDQLDDACRPAAGRPSTEAGTPSFLLDYWNNPEHDEAHGVIERNEHGMILLNRYPYSNGHLLVALGEARPRLLDYESSQRANLWALVDRATDLVERTLECQGINIGVNQGRAAGAGIPQHLHVHIVPRWSGDTNFITTVGEVRVVPEALERMYARFRRTISSEGSD